MVVPSWTDSISKRVLNRAGVCFGALRDGYSQGRAILSHIRVLCVWLEGVEIGEQ